MSVRVIKRTFQRKYAANHVMTAARRPIILATPSGQWFSADLRPAALNAIGRQLLTPAIEPNYIPTPNSNRNRVVIPTLTTTWPQH